jgi:GGDEF domain-containing protein
VGVSFFLAGSEDTFETLYQRADKGMYESKKCQGNAVKFK